MKKLAGITLLTLFFAAVFIFATFSSAAESQVDETVAEDVFEYVSGGVTKRAGAGVTFGEVVAAADAGSTIRMLSDYTEESSKNGAIATVNKRLTLDMQGHVFTIRDRYDNSTDIGQPTVYVKTTDGFTLKNGTLAAGHVTATYHTRAYPFFLYASNGARLELENVNTYLSTIAYNWGQEDVFLDILGGEHHSVFGGYGCDGGLFNTRSGVTTNVTGARINIAKNSWLIASMHQNADAAVKVSTLTFTDCVINTETDSTQIVKYASEYTKIYFNGCKIDGGIIKPTVTDGEAKKGIGAALPGSIVLGEGTVFSAGLDYDDRVAVEDGCVIAARDGTAKASFRMSSGTQSTGFTVGAAADVSFPVAYGVVDESELRIATVRWYDRAGQLITTTTAGIGSYLTPITLDEYEYESCEWYDVIFDGWSRTQGGVQEREIIVEGDLDLYLTRGSVRADVEGVLYNLSLLGHVQTNVYLPSDTPENVEIVGVYSSRIMAETDRSPISYSIARNTLGKTYRAYVAGYAGATALGTPNEVWIRLRIEEGGVESTVFQSVKLSALGYIKAMLSDSETDSPSYSRTAHEMIANIVRYSYVLESVVGRAHDPEVEALYEKYSDLCREIDNTTDQDFPTPTVTLGDAEGYLESITFEVSSYQPRYRISFRRDANVTDARLGLVGWYAAGRSRPNWMEQYYKYSPDDVLYYDTEGQYVNSSGKVTDEGGNVQDGKSAGANTGNIAVAFFDAIQIYNIDVDITVSLTLADGRRAEGQYNVDCYYNGIKESVGDDLLERVRYFLKVMREYGDSVERYAFNTGKVPLDAMETNTVKYSDFGAVGDGVTNDFDAIKKTHEYANEMGYKVEADPDATYYVGRTFGETVEIRTDTDWQGATFIIDDTCFDVSDKDRAAHVFTVRSEYKEEIFTPTAGSEAGRALIEINKNGGIRASDFERLELGLGYPALVYLYNDNHRSYIRYGENQDAGQAQRELVKIDASGNVDDATPLLFDYDCVTKIRVVRTDDAPIVVGYGNFVTRANAAPRQYTYYNRGILVQRSNTTITDIDHKIVGEGESGAPYSGFISVSLSDAVMVLDSVLSAHKAYKLEGNDHNTMGSYDLSPSDLNDLYVYNVTMHNFFGEDGVTPSVNCGWWGIMGSNYCKNLTYDTCRLTRFDAHCGTYNATIRNSEVGTLTLIGGGLFTLENTVVHTATRSNIITLRTDYGSTWRGEFLLKNVTVKSTNFTGGTMAIVNGAHTNWDFGYACYMPERITVDNLVCTAESVKTVLLANGTIANADISDGLLDGKENLNPYNVTRVLVVRNNKMNYSFTLPKTNTYADTEIVYE